MKVGLGRWIALSVGLSLVIAGLVASATGAGLPAFSDGAAFERGVEDLLTRRAGDPGFGSDKASAAYYELLDRYETPRARLNDAGLGMVSLGATVLLACIPWASRLLLRTHGLMTTFLLCWCFAGLLCLGGAVSVVTAYERGWYPPWADTLAVPLAGLTGLFPFLGVGLMLLLGPAHLRRSRGAPLLGLPVRWSAGSVIAHLVYGCAMVGVLALAAALLVQTDPAGWLVLPVIVGVFWLFAHGRAVASAPCRSRAELNDPSVNLVLPG